jgi:membrane protein required for colicin V production
MVETAGSYTWMIDAGVIGLIVWFALRGWSDGLISGAFGVVGLIAGVWAGAEFAPAVGPLFGVETTGGYLYAAGFLTILIVVAITVRVIAIIVLKVIEVTPLGLIDNAAGAAFGAFKALLLLAVLAIPVKLVARDSALRSTYLESLPVRLGTETGATVVSLIENHASDRMKQFISEVGGMTRDHADDAVRDEFERRGKKLLEEELSE